MTEMQHIFAKQHCEQGTALNLNLSASAPQRGQKNAVHFK